MNSNIACNQNSDSHLAQLAASSQTYSRAKLIVAIQFALTVPAALVWSLIVASRPEWKIWAGFYAFTVAITDALFLERLQSKLRKEGATIQELFDCQLFEIPWRKLVAGDPVESEIVHERGQQYLRKPSRRHTLVDWYPLSVAQLPLSAARILCQRINCRWDSRLRERYVTALSATIVVVLAVAVAIAIQSKMTVETFLLAIVAPLTPAILWGAREIRKHRDAATSLSRLITHVEQVWQEAKSGAAKDAGLLEDAVAIQDQIYAHRVKNPLIFNWVHRLLHGREQALTDNRAAEMVCEFLEAAYARKP